MGVHSKTGRQRKGLFGRRRNQDRLGQIDELAEVRPAASADTVVAEVPVTVSESVGAPTWTPSSSPGPESAPVAPAAPLPAPRVEVAPPAPVDPLTGLGRRDALIEHLANLDGRAAALILFDMDDFGRYNEQWGRDAGDEAIRAIAATLAAAAGDRGKVFRSGGDQFAAVIQTGFDQHGSASAWANDALAALAPLPASGAVVVLRHGYRPEASLRDGELTLVALKEAGGAMIGAHGPHVDAWARSRRHEIGALARQVEELQMENQRLSQGMLVDPDMGLPNATAFDADHMQLDYRRRRSDDPYSMLLIEIDYFDELCANCGPEAGLEAQKAVATTVSRTVRGSDRTYTLGSEGFAVLLPGAEMREAVVAAERCRIRVEKLAVANPASPAGIVTVTLAAMTAGFRHKTTKDVLVEVQDLLRTGAQKNRNRVLWPL